MYSLNSGLSATKEAKQGLCRLLAGISNFNSEAANRRPRGQLWEVVLAVAQAPLPAADFGCVDFCPKLSDTEGGGLPSPPKLCSWGHFYF